MTRQHTTRTGVNGIAHQHNVVTSQHINTVIRTSVFNSVRAFVDSLYFVCSRQQIERYERFSDPERKLNGRARPRTWRDARARRQSRPKGFTEESIKAWQPPAFKNNNKLKMPYQLEGVQWLIFNWHQRRNSILADEMV
jgi:hypothetical protein